MEFDGTKLDDIRAQRMDHEAIDSAMPSQPRFALCDSNDGDSSICLISESDGEDDDGDSSVCLISESEGEDDE